MPGAVPQDKWRNHCGAHGEGIDHAGGVVLSAPHGEDVRGWGRTAGYFLAGNVAPSTVKHADATQSNILGSASCCRVRGGLLPPSYYAHVGYNRKRELPPAVLSIYTLAFDIYESVQTLSGSVGLPLLLCRRLRIHEPRLLEQSQYVYRGC